MGWYLRWSYKSLQGNVSSSGMVQACVIRIRALGSSHALHSSEHGEHPWNMQGCSLEDAQAKDNAAGLEGKSRRWGEVSGLLLSIAVRKSPFCTLSPGLCVECVLYHLIVRPRQREYMGYSKRATEHACGLSLTHRHLHYVAVPEPFFNILFGYAAHDGRLRSTRVPSLRSSSG